MACEKSNQHLIESQVFVSLAKPCDVRLSTDTSRGEKLILYCMTDKLTRDDSLGAQSKIFEV